MSCFREYEYIKTKYNGEIPYKYGREEVGKLMQEYAEYYHQRRVELLKKKGEIGECDHPWATVLGDGETSPAKCLRCDKILSE